MTEGSAHTPDGAPTSGTALAQGIPDGGLLLVPGQRHCLHLECTEATDAVRDLLAAG